MESQDHRYRLLIACPDRPGIIAAVSDLLYGRGANITSFDQYSEGPEGGYFFMRAEFEVPAGVEEEELAAALGALAPAYGMRWSLHAAARRQRLAVFVSREDHCLNELLWQTRRGEIAADVALVISNHPDAEEAVRAFGIPFYHIPVPPGGKARAEAQALELLEGRVDTIVLARYMQILSPDFVARFPARIINIHHSFLPAFVGPRPYQQAYERGVKLIGATAHYVTADLDAGPIIEQDVQRVDHRHRLADFRRIGRHIERMVLARAVAWHVEDRVLVHDNRTVVFPR
ncbi:formyltetrahydrofolate hydrolase [Candidatus Hydrogenisulfobacillus filiaventi]|uniref:Formyltetrahydrofolate deformylase n=1 Tax=Candidatus Hydrogenisulfobacillus filiaventi TaxID=2707344 RepID=A0A6F8ZG29_9FIRM|nr:formyltetrahydrofolate deformylase [Bacillota bacterium]CAB1128623.1 formyltetrahydrofolate hydrolase [Candidatus Hydrogenisulfobacillus filiaventi]